MSKEHPQLPRIKPVGHMMLNPRIRTETATWHRDGRRSWTARKTYPMPTGLGHTISYLPAGMVTATDDARMVRESDPSVRWWWGCSGLMVMRMSTAWGAAAHTKAGV